MKRADTSSFRRAEVATKPMPVPGKRPVNMLYARTERDYRRALRDCVKLSDVQEAMVSLVKNAREGDTKAAIFVVDLYTRGRLKLDMLLADDLIGRNTESVIIATERSKNANSG